MDYFPDNTLTNFTTKLHNEISLKDEWEMGLAEIIFPKRLLNVDENQHVTLIRYLSSQQPSTPSSTECLNFMVKYPVKAKYYANVEELAYELNNAMRGIKDPANVVVADDVGEKIFDTLRYMLQNGLFTGGKNDSQLASTELPTFSYSQYEKKVRVELPPFTEIILSADLRQIMGFNLKERICNLTDVKKVCESAEEIRLDPNRQTFFIYCDVLENVPVGDTVAPLLRTIDVEGERGTMIHRNFEQPRYLPIQKKNFDSVQIDIRDGLGRPIPFEGDTLIVTLHLRRANLPYFLT